MWLSITSFGYVLLECKIIGNIALFFYKVHVVIFKIEKQRGKEIFSVSIIYSVGKMLKKDKKDKIQNFENQK